jgi:hypothetical protein
LWRLRRRKGIVLTCRHLMVILTTYWLRRTRKISKNWRLLEVMKTIHLHQVLILITTY